MTCRFDRQAPTSLCSEAVRCRNSDRRADSPNGARTSRGRGRIAIDGPTPPLWRSSHRGAIVPLRLPPIFRHNLPLPAPVDGLCSGKTPSICGLGASLELGAIVEVVPNVVLARPEGIGCGLSCP